MRRNSFIEFNPSLSALVPPLHYYWFHWLPYTHVIWMCFSVPDGMHVAIRSHVENLSSNRGARLGFWRNSRLPTTVPLPPCQDNEPTATDINVPIKLRIYGKSYSLVNYYSTWLLSPHAWHPAYNNFNSRVKFANLMDSKLNQRRSSQYAWNLHTQLLTLTSLKNIDYFLNICLFCPSPKLRIQP